jgi:hypothetical protein
MRTAKANALSQMIEWVIKPINQSVRHVLLLDQVEFFEN